MYWIACYNRLWSIFIQNLTLKLYELIPYCSPFKDVGRQPHSRPCLMHTRHTCRIILPTQCLPHVITLSYYQGEHAVTLPTLPSPGVAIIECRDLEEHDQNSSRSGESPNEFIHQIWIQSDDNTYKCIHRLSADGWKLLNNAKAKNNCNQR